MNANRSLDFPVWLPSALVKELRQGLRTPSFNILACLFPGLLALLFFFSFIIGPDGSPYVDQDGCAAFLWASMSVSLLLVMPLRAMGSVREELAQRNSELLLLTRQTTGRIVMGKWASYMAQSTLLVCISLPFFLIRYYYGHIDLLSDLETLVYICAGSCVLTAFALWAATQPVLVRLVALGGIVTPIFLAFDIFEGISIFEEGYLLLSSLALIDAALLTSCLLLLARVYFAPAAQNAAAAFRGLLLGAMAANGALLFACQGSAYASVLILQTTFLIFSFLMLTILHLNDPTRPLPIHIERTEGKPLALFRRLFFLPGLPSGILFTLLLAVMASLSVSLLDGEGTIDLDSWPKQFCLTIGLWYAVAMPAMILKPFRKKLKNYLLLGYMLLWVPLGLILSILHTLKVQIPVLPGGNLFDMEEASSVAIALVNLAVGMATLYFGNREWFALRRKIASKAAPDASMADRAV